MGHRRGALSNIAKLRNRFWKSLRFDVASTSIWFPSTFKNKTLLVNRFQTISGRQGVETRKKNFSSHFVLQKSMASLLGTRRRRSERGCEVQRRKSVATKDWWKLLAEAMDARERERERERASSGAQGSLGEREGEQGWWDLTRLVLCLKVGPDMESDVGC